MLNYIALDIKYFPDNYFYFCFYFEILIIIVKNIGLWKNFLKPLDIIDRLEYNVFCGRRMRLRPIIGYRRGGFCREENLPAQKAPQKEGARLHEENVWPQRQKGLGSQKGKGQSKIDSLTELTTKLAFCGLFFEAETRPQLSQKEVCASSPLLPFFNGNTPKRW